MLASRESKTVITSGGIGYASREIISYIYYHIRLRMRRFFLFTIPGAA